MYVASRDQDLTVWKNGPVDASQAGRVSAGMVDGPVQDRQTQTSRMA